MEFQHRYGVEEEFFICDEDGEALRAMPRAFWRSAQGSVPGVSKELLQSQIELQTDPCGAFGECLGQLSERRGMLSGIAAEHGIRLMACGTHPTMDWRDAVMSSGPRYAKLERGMRMLAGRNLYCGMHVHVETPPEIDRIKIINRAVSYLPLFLALSVSSPFWLGARTGLMGYRLAGYDELPRTGLPPVLDDEAAFAAYVQALNAASHIANASFVWWAIRPSNKYPTIELRICDAVTDVRHSAAISALFRALVRRLCRDAAFGPTPSPLLRAIVDENRWQVQCDGVAAVLSDPATFEPAPARTLIERLCADLDEDLEALNCVEALAGVRAILDGGASAQRQVEIYERDLAANGDAAAALAAVKKFVLDKTAAA